MPVSVSEKGVSLHWLRWFRPRDFIVPLSAFGQCDLERRKNNYITNLQCLEIVKSIGALFVLYYPFLFLLVGYWTARHAVCPDAFLLHVLWTLSNIQVNDRRLDAQSVELSRLQTS